MTAARKIVQNVLGSDMTDEIWTGNYHKVLPISIQDFDLSAVLPAVFYMFRFGKRRGAGRFLEAFVYTADTKKTHAQRRREATVDRVASVLCKNDHFKGFEGAAERAVLGDLLLCFCLENRRNALGRTEQIRRVAPVHYMASWIDLPGSVGHLRQVPEMIVSTLANQSGESVEISGDADETPFPVGRGHERNVLLRAFRQGIELDGPLGDRTSDRFVEADESIGLDQLLMIRLARQLCRAPEKLHGKDKESVSNQRPVAERASEEFSEDVRRFIRSYSDVIPRHAFLEFLESGMSLGLTTIVSSTISILFEWSEKGRIPDEENQSAIDLFVDCSNGTNRQLRMAAEQSMDEFMRRVERVPVVLMMLRLLDRGARRRRLEIPSCPSAAKWLNLLGEILRKRHSEAQAILDRLDEDSIDLVEKLKEDYPEEARILDDDEGEPNAARRMAEALVVLIGRGQMQKTLIGMIDSALLVGRPNGMASRRSVSRNDPTTGKRRRRVARSLVFTDSMLDYLAHLHVLRAKDGRGFGSLSFQRFISGIRTRYGLHVDSAPPGMTISSDLLRRNRAVIERRLRDLGLLTGVNDAEAMKRLRPRFHPFEEA